MSCKSHVNVKFGPCKCQNRSRKKTSSKAVNYGVSRSRYRQWIWDHFTPCTWCYDRLKMSFWFTHEYLAFTAEFRSSSVVWTLYKVAKKCSNRMQYSGSDTPIYNLSESGPGWLSKTCWNLTFTSTFTFWKTDMYISANRHLHWHLQSVPVG